MSSLEAAAARPKQRFDNIDLLRAIAIIPVLLFHYTTRFPLEFYDAVSVPFHCYWGKFGVDLFFVVSGYCIFLTLDSSSSLSNFWAKRLARLQPAYMLSILITFLAVSAFGLPGRQTTPPVALANVFWLNAIPTIPHVDGVYWSLIVELKFYFFIGMIYWASKGKSVSLLWGIFCAFGAIVHRTFPLVGEWLLIAPYAPTFLVGLLAYEAPKLSKMSLALLCILSMGLVGLSPRFTEAPWIGIGIAVLGYLVLQMRWLKVPKPITYVGLVSYSLYLIHDNLGLILIRSLSPLDMAIRISVTVIVTIALAAIITRTVEIRWQKPLTKAFQSALEGAWGKLPRPRRYRVVSELRRW